MSMTFGVKTKLEYGDLAAVPNDNQRYELMDGDLYVTPSPGTAHQRVSKRLQRLLETYFEGRRLGEVFNAPYDVILSRRDVVVPDLVVVANPAQISERGAEGAPLLLVEIISPSSVDMDREVKAARYAQFGVPHYWIVDPPARTVECFRLAAGAYELVARVTESERFAHPDWPELVIDAPALWASA
jgi:Uma2 family endonuclease